MKKNDLIEMLQGIEGNPEIVIYNSVVEDFQFLDGISSRVKLYKLKRQYFEKIAALELSENISPEDIPNGDFQQLVKDRKLYSNCKWELPENLLVRNLSDTVSKKVVVLFPKQRGKSLSVRGMKGDMEY